MHLGFEHQTLRIHEQMALSTLHLLATVVTSLLSSYTNALHRLAVDDAGARLGIPPHTPHAHPLAQGRVHPPPCTVDPPSSEVMVDGLPGRKVVRYETPGTPATDDVEDDV